MRTIKLGVIGTAGRGAKDEANPVKLNAALWAKMKAHFFDLIASLGEVEVELVSGGAPWADHLAVAAYNEGLVASLKLYLPAEFDAGGFVPNSAVEHNPGKRLNQLHDAFSKTAKIDSKDEIAVAIAHGAKVEVRPGFFNRNAYVALHAKDYLAAYSFGVDVKAGNELTAEEAQIPSGGTAFTWNESVARVKHSVPLAELAGFAPVPADPAPPAVESDDEESAEAEVLQSPGVFVQELHVDEVKPTENPFEVSEETANKFEALIGVLEKHVGDEVNEETKAAVVETVVEAAKEPYDYPVVSAANLSITAETGVIPLEEVLSAAGLGTANTAE